VDDLTLAQAVRAGDEAAEALFFKRYHPRLAKAAVYFLGPQDPEVEDVVQQAFLIAFQKLDAYDPARASLYTWMARICVNLCYQRLDKRRREQATAWEDLEAAVAPIAAQRDADRDAETRKQGLLAVLRDAMKGLGKACRDLLELRDQRGLSYADVGRQLKVPIGTVMSRLSRCRQTLKELVQGMEGGHA
jgi:RNA polymerase sigma-70 factor (ECF subfamily)